MSEIRVLLTYEILGRPPEYIRDALEKFINDFDTKEKIKLISKKIYQPKPLEKKDKKEEKEDVEGFFTTFAEVELELEELNILFNIVLNTLPANVEVLSPTTISMNNFNISELLSELTIKLHKFDEVAKILVIERDNLARELNQIKSNSQVKVGMNIKPENKEEKKSENKREKIKNKIKEDK